MSGVLEGLNQVSAAAIAAVLNSLWQGAAVAALAWAAMRFAARMNAATRHAVWWVVLGVVLLFPLVRGRNSQHAQAPPTASTTGYSTDELVAPPETAVAAVTPTTSAVSQSDEFRPAALEVRGGTWPAWITAFWLTVLTFQLGRIAWSYRYLRGVKRSAQTPEPHLRRNFDAWLMSCGVGRPARLLVSREIASPMAVGFRSPAVVLPEPLLTQFQEPELDHVLLHELAHIARRDDWTNLAARVASAVVGLHPVAAWILRRIEREREIACDDWVVAMTGSARPYAASLARLFEVCFARRRMLLASPMAGSSSHLGERIEMLLHRSREFTPKASVSIVAMASVVLVAVGTAGALTPHWLEFAEPAAPVTAAEAQELPQPAPAALPAPAVAPARPSPFPVPAVAPVPPATESSPQTSAPAAPVPFPQPASASAPAVAPVPPATGLAPQASAPAAPAPFPQPASAPVPALAPAPPSPGSAPRAYAPFPAAAIPAPASTPAPDPPSTLWHRLAFAHRLPAPPAGWAAAVSAPSAPQAATTPPPAIAPTRPPGAPASSGSFLAALVAAGYGNLPVDEIIDMKNAGVSAEFLTGMNQAGWGKLSSKELIELSQRGVSPEYMRRIKEAGIRNLALKDVIDLASFGVRPALIQEIHSLGFGPYTAQQAAQLANCGLRPELFHALKDAGLGNAPLSEIIEAHQTGLSGRDLREARQYGTSLTLKQIIRLKTAGVI